MLQAFKEDRGKVEDLTHSISTIANKNAFSVTSQQSQLKITKLKITNFNKELYNFFYSCTKQRFALWGDSKDVI